jgi:hypothetical protein
VAAIFGFVRFDILSLMYNSEKINIMQKHPALVVLGLILTVFFIAMPLMGQTADETPAEPSEENLRDSCRSMVENSFDEDAISEFVTIKTQTYKPDSGSTFTICTADVKSRSIPMDRVIVVQKNRKTVYFWKGFAPHGIRNLKSDGSRFDLDLETDQYVSFPGDAASKKSEQTVSYCAPLDQYARYCPEKKTVESVKKMFSEGDVEYIDFANVKKNSLILVHVDQAPFLVSVNAKNEYRKLQLINRGTNMKTYRLTVNSEKPKSSALLIEVLDMNDHSRGQVMTLWEPQSGKISKFFANETFDFSMKWSDPKTLETIFTLPLEYSGPGAFLDFDEKKTLCEDPTELNYGTPLKVEVSFKVEGGKAPKDTSCKITDPPPT